MSEEQKLKVQLLSQSTLSFKTVETNQIKLIILNFIVIGEHAVSKHLD